MRAGAGHGKKRYSYRTTEWAAGTSYLSHRDISAGPPKHRGRAVLAAIDCVNPGQSVELPAGPEPPGELADSAARLSQIGQEWAGPAGNFA